MSKRKNEFSPATRQIIHDRADGTCEVMLFPHCRGLQGLQYHHRKNRSQGGMGDVENGLLVCLWCHEWIGKNPAESYRLGFLVKSMKDPAEVTVARRGRVVLLDSEGGFEINEEGG